MHRGNNWKRNSDKERYKNRPVYAWMTNGKKLTHAHFEPTNKQNKQKITKIKAMLLPLAVMPTVNWM